MAIESSDAKAALLSLYLSRYPPAGTHNCPSVRSTSLQKHTRHRVEQKRCHKRKMPSGRPKIAAVAAQRATSEVRATVNCLDGFQSPTKHEHELSDHRPIDIDMVWTNSRPFTWREDQMVKVNAGWGDIESALKPWMWKPAGFRAPLRKSSYPKAEPVPLQPHQTYTRDGVDMMGWLPNLSRRMSLEEADMLFDLFIDTSECEQAVRRVA